MASFAEFTVTDGGNKITINLNQIIFARPNTLTGDRENTYLLLRGNRGEKSLTNTVYVDEKYEAVARLLVMS